MQPVPPRSELVHLLLAVLERPERPIQLPLVLERRLGPRDRLDLPRRAAHKDLELLALLGPGDALLDRVGGDVAAQAGPVGGRLVEDVVDLEARVALGERVELLAEEDAAGRAGGRVSIGGCKWVVRD